MRRSIIAYEKVLPPPIKKNKTSRQERQSNRMTRLAGNLSLLLNFLLKLPCSGVKKGILILWGHWERRVCGRGHRMQMTPDAIFNTLPQPVPATAGLVAHSADNWESGQCLFCLLNMARFPVLLFLIQENTHFNTAILGGAILNSLFLVYAKK